MIYLFLIGLSFVLAILFTPLVRLFANRFGYIDVPRPPRNLHSKPTPLLGGLAVFLAFAVATSIYLYFGEVDFHIVPVKFFVGIAIGALILMLEGFLDDKFNLPPKILWIFPALASLAIVFSGIGIGIKSLSNPFGDPISFSFLVLGIPASGIFVWLWMMGMMFTTKFLDGLDGLVVGIGAIASFTLFLLSLASNINQPITASIAILFCGALLGYLVYAFHPAKIFLGDGGSMLVGFILGVLSVILGGKIATALLVMGIPILDVAWVILRRLWYKQSPFKGDRQHLHFRLMDIGLSQRQTVLSLYAISAMFGFTAVFLQSFGKLIALLILFAVMLSLGLTSVMLYKRKFPHIPEN